MPTTVPASASALLGRLVPGLLTLPAALSAAVEAGATSFEREQGPVLPGAGGVCAGLLLLERGALLSKMASEDGRMITLHRARPGAPCGHLLRCLRGTGRYAASCEVESPARGVLLAPALVDRLLVESPAFRAFAFDAVAGRLRAAQALACATVFEPLDRRVAAALLERAERAGADDLPLTHQQLADELGCTREAASRALERLEGAKAVVLGRGRVRIRDRDALQGPGGRVEGANDSLRQRAVSSPRPDRLASTLTR